MVMEYLDGESLGKPHQGRGRLQPHEAWPILQQLLSGLAAAHAAGIVHRDLKPDNVFLASASGGYEGLREAARLRRVEVLVGRQRG
jgi:serine/threonine protein kinase